jgi:hypothetical protein
MRAMEANPGAYTDEQRAALVAEFNQAVRRASASTDGEPPEPVDVAELERQMVEASALAGRGELEQAEADRLAERYLRASAALLETRVSELEGLLKHEDLLTRAQAGAELARRGALDPAVAERLAAETVATHNALAREITEGGPLGLVDLEEVPAAYRPLAEEMAQAARDEEERRGGQDAPSALLSRFDEWLRTETEQRVRSRLASVGTPTTEPAGGSPPEEVRP